MSYRAKDDTRKKKDLSTTDQDQLLIPKGSLMCLNKDNKSRNIKTCIKMKTVAVWPKKSDISNSQLAMYTSPPLNCLPTICLKLDISKVNGYQIRAI